MKKFMLTAGCCMLAAAGMADVALDSVFSSDMVLQREVPVAFFGKADAGTAVKVDFAGKTRSVKADANGAWRAQFPAMKADRVNYKVVVSDGKKEIVLNDVLIGDVWFCSGQSNMTMPIGWGTPGWSARDCRKEIASANYPEIRYAAQLNRVSHLKDIPAALKDGHWVKTSPRVAAAFSATAYFFGRTLYRDLNVPIGLVVANWGGTGIRGWISYEGYRDAGLKSELAQIDKFRMTPAEKAAYESGEWRKYHKSVNEFLRKFNAAGAKEHAQCQEYAKPGYDDSQWQTAVQGINAPMFLWFRSKFKLVKTARGKNIEIVAGKTGMAADVWVNGKRVGGYAADAPEKDKKICVTVPSGDLNQTGDNTIAIRCTLFQYRNDGNQMQGLIHRTCYRCGKFSARIGGWKIRSEFSLKDAKNRLHPPRELRLAFQSFDHHSNLYHGMVAAWTRLPIKGVIWYQGCSNIWEQGLHYYLLNKALINDWRSKWKQPDMPFMIVQLAGYGRPKNNPDWKLAEPEENSYARIRDNQYELRKIPNVGLATAIDIGEFLNIHPPEKQELGRRLALEAERIAYGKKIVSRGPDFAGARAEGNVIRVSFVNADNGLKTKDGKAPGAFAIAGADKKFVWANAKIDGKTVVVSSPKITAPQYVRYAYASYRGDCNLQNAEGLPAYPFRSDAFDYTKAK